MLPTILLAVVLLQTAARPAAAARIAVVLSPAEAYEQVAGALEAELKRKGHEPIRFKLPQRKEAESRKDAAPEPADEHSEELQQLARSLARDRIDAIAAIGAPATSFALQSTPDSHAPVVYCMVSHALDRDFGTTGDAARRLIRLTSDVAPADQAVGIERLSPRVRRIGILHGSRSQRTAEALRTALNARQIAVELIPAAHDRFPEAVEALNSRKCDGLLMLADAEVYNSTNVPQALLWGLRGKKPVWAFSSNLVKAGAFAALYTDAEQVAAQTVSLLERALCGEEPARLGLQYPSSIQTALNERTAGMIGISVPKDVLDSIQTRHGQP